MRGGFPKIATPSQIFLASELKLILLGDKN